MCSPRSENVPLSGPKQYLARGSERADSTPSESARSSGNRWHREVFSLFFCLSSHQLVDAFSCLLLLGGAEAGQNIQDLGFFDGLVRQRKKTHKAGAGNRWHVFVSCLCQTGCQVSQKDDAEMFHKLKTSSFDSHNISGGGTYCLFLQMLLSDLTLLTTNIKTWLNEIRSITGN